jgi:hypothetical protein
MYRCYAINKPLINVVCSIIVVIFVFFTVQPTFAAVYDKPNLYLPVNGSSNKNYNGFFMASMRTDHKVHFNLLSVYPATNRADNYTRIRAKGFNADLDKVFF